MEEVIKEGEKEKQGSHVCPRCGRVVLIKHYFGDPPTYCDIPYISRQGTEWRR